jgi:PAS domain S-box-containing protein
METEQGLRDMRVRKARQDTRLLFITGILLAISLGLLLAIYTRRQLLRLSQTYSKWVNLAERRAQDLQDSHEWLDTTLHSIGDAVIATDVKGMLQFMNPIAEKVTGWTREEAQGRPLREVFNISNEQTHEPVESPVQKVMRLGTVVGLGNHTMLRRKDGSEVPIDDSGAPIRHRNGEIFGVVLVFRDVSGRRRAEQAMRSSEKLAVVGRLAASIAHEIHNPLDSVYNLLYLLERNPGLPAEARDMTQIAMDELARVTQITRQMLTYTRETQMPVEVKPSDLLDSVLTLYSGRINSGQIHLHREYDFAGSIRTYPGEMRQVFSNLLLNAFDAVGQGGTVKLRLAQSRDWGHEERAGVRVTISDNGTGIRPEHRARVLEPFFTTKGEKGTGLGLWVTAGILNKYGGSMRFRTSQQPRYRGTVFSVFIPDAALEVQPSAMDARAS